MIVESGQIALVLALIASIYAASGSILGVARRSSELLVSGRYALYSVLPLLLVSTAALVYAFVTNDFSVQYVAENSNLAMPQAYTWVAFYAGNAGSMLYIAVVFSLMAVIAVVGIRKGAAVYVALRHRHHGTRARVPARRNGVPRQPAREARYRPGRRPGDQPAARPLRDVHSPATCRWRVLSR